MYRLIVLTVVTLTIFIGPAFADQEDGRLNDLFTSLKSAKNVQQAQQFEQEIWRIWGEIDDKAGARLLERGSSAMAGRNFQRSLTDFNKLVELAPEFAEGWNKRATLYYLMGKYEKSVADIQQTLALEPRHFGALSGLGLIMMALDRPEIALKSFEAALAVHPKMPSASIHVKELLERVKGEAL